MNGVSFWPAISSQLCVELLLGFHLLSYLDSGHGNSSPSLGIVEHTTHHFTGTTPVNHPWGSGSDRGTVLAARDQTHARFLELLSQIIVSAHS